MANHTLFKFVERFQIPNIRNSNDNETIDQRLSVTF